MLAKIKNYFKKTFVTNVVCFFEIMQIIWKIICKLTHKYVLKMTNNYYSLSKLEKLAISCAMLLALLPISTASVYAETATYSYSGDTLTITGTQILDGTIVNAGLNNHSEITKVVISGYFHVRDAAFQNNTALVSITIPSSVTTIDALAFSGCTNLTSIIFTNSTIPSNICDNAFGGISANGTVYIANSDSSARDSILNDLQAWEDQLCTGDYTGPHLPLAWTITEYVSKATIAASDFTFTAPTILTAGTARSASVTAASGVTGMGDITVYYSSDNGSTWNSTAPSTAGTYKVAIDVTEGTSYKAGTKITADTWTFTLSPSSPTVAKIDTTEYTTLDAALNAAQDGDTITLLTDVSSSSTVNIPSSFSGALTLDLDNPKIDVTSPYTAALSFSPAEGNNPTLNIKNGTVTDVNNQGIYMGRGYLNVENVTISHTRTNGACYGITMRNGELKIKNSTISGPVQFQEANTNGNLIENCVLTSIFKSGTGTLTINNSNESENIKGQVTLRAGKIVFESGYSNSNTGIGIECSDGTELSITGGKFTGTAVAIATDAAATISISGGYYLTAPNDAYIATGYEIVDTPDGAEKTAGFIKMVSSSTPTLTTTVNGTISSVTYSGGQLDNGGTVSGISKLKIMNSASSNGSMWLNDDVIDGFGSYSMQFTAGYNKTITLDNTKSYRISWVGTTLCIDESLSGTPTNWTLINSLSDNITFDSNVDYANAVLFAGNKTFTKEYNVIIYATKTESGTVYYNVISITDKINVPFWLSSADLTAAITDPTVEVDTYVIGTVSSGNAPNGNNNGGFIYVPSGNGGGSSSGSSSLPSSTSSKPSVGESVVKEAANGSTHIAEQVVSNEEKVEVKPVGDVKETDTAASLTNKSEKEVKALVEAKNTDELVKAAIDTSFFEVNVAMSLATDNTSERITSANLNSSKIENLAEAVAGILTPEEMTQVLTGKDTVRIDVEVDETNTKASTPVTEVMKDTHKVANVLDVNIFKTINGIKSKMTEVGKEVAITINVGTAITDKKDVQVIRLHDGKAEYVKTINNQDGSITVYSDLYSEFVIVTSMEEETKPVTPIKNTGSSLFDRVIYFFKSLF